MSSKWAETLPASLKNGIGRGLGLRVAVWYAAVFVTSVIVLVALIYWLLSSSLKQRDHEIIQSTLRAYAFPTLGDKEVSTINSKPPRNWDPEAATTSY